MALFNFIFLQVFLWQGTSAKAHEKIHCWVLKLILKTFKTRRLVETASVANIQPEGKYSSWFKGLQKLKLAMNVCSLQLTFLFLTH